MAAQSSLIKTILHNSIAEGIYDEIVNRNARYYYFLGKTLSWEDELSPPTPIDSFDYELKTRNEVITLKEIKPTDVAFVVPRYNWTSGLVYDMYDDQYCKELQGINLINGGLGYGLSPRVYIGSAGSILWSASTSVAVGDFLKVQNSGTQTYRYYIAITSGTTGTTTPAHTNGTQVNGTVTLQHYEVSDGGGTGAAAEASILDGQVIDITLTSRGTNYTSIPSVIIASIGNGGLSAYGEAVVTIAPSGVQKLEDSRFYVVTDEFNVYKCLDNNNNSPSTFKPLGTTVDPVTFPDGYMWKFLFNVPVALRNKFLTDDYIPVVTALRNQFYSNGNIQTVRIDQAGANYTSGAITVQGDGYLEADPFYLNGFTLVDGGSGYQDDSTINVSPPFANASVWLASTLLLVGQRTIHNNNIYEVVVSGTTSITGPVHKTGIAENGSCALKYLGTVATGDVVVQSGVITSVKFYGSLRDLNISSFGNGYTSVPPITISSPFYTSASSVNTTTDVITLSDVHPLKTGESIIYTAGSAAIGGLVTGQTYYVIRESQTKIKLASSNANALAGTSINLTSAGTGTQTFTYVIGTATAVAVMQGGRLAKIIITNGGAGYLSAPTVVFGTQWTASTALTVGQQVFFSNRLYTVTSAGTTGSSAPVHISGAASNGTATLTYAGFPITAVATLKFGSGYDIASPAVTVGSLSGTDAEILFTGIKSEAKLVPYFEDGQLAAVQIDDGGIGYSYAVLTVTGDGTGAELTADLSPGDINTLQANTELLTLDGRIMSIQTISRGYGYATASVVIDGDGTGATANAVIENGYLKKIVMTNYGSGYRWATATIVGNGYGAKIRPVITPYGGHGKNSLNGLFARTLMFYSNVSADKNQGFAVNNDYRQTGIIKNPRQYDSTYAVTTILGSACWVIAGNISTTFFPVDSIVTVADTNKRFRVVTNTGNAILVQSLDNFEPVIGTTFVGNGGYTFTASAVSAPSVDKYSGDLMFIDNKSGFTPTTDQSVTLRTIIRF
jgi:hypothetical protein